MAIRGNKIKAENIQIKRNVDGKLEQRFQNPHLKELEFKYREDLLKLGFTALDVDVLLKKGIQSCDLALAVDQLCALQAGAKDRAMSDLTRQRKLLQKHEKNELAKKLESQKFGDIRDEFKEAIPVKAPDSFKPLDVHKKLCKICYKNEKDCVLMPCKHRLFCYGCA